MIKLAASGDISGCGNLIENCIIGFVVISGLVRIEYIIVVEGVLGLFKRQLFAGVTECKGGKH